MGLAILFWGLVAVTIFGMMIWTVGKIICKGVFKVYEVIYYNSLRFKTIKNQIQTYVQNCNKLNEHIEGLKNVCIGDDQLDYGKSSYQDISQWNYKRPELKQRKYMPHIYNCSRYVCDNASQQPFKYVCKYFNIKVDEDVLEQFEAVLNNY